MRNDFYLPATVNIITVLILMERMIQFKISFSQILITFIYGAIDDLYQKIVFFKIEIMFSSYVVLD